MMNLLFDSKPDVEFVVIWLFAALMVKHFICDFLLQGPYQYLNKGRYLHLGGLLHVLITMVGTLPVLWFFWAILQWGEISIPDFTDKKSLKIWYLFYLRIAPWAIILKIIAIEGLIHYHTDWLKVKLTKGFGLKPDKHESFWYLLGADQLIHNLTYALIVLLFLKWLH